MKKYKMKTKFLSCEDKLLSVQKPKDKMTPINFLPREPCTETASVRAKIASDVKAKLEDMGAALMHQRSQKLQTSQS